MEDPYLNLSMTVTEAQTVLDALGELPHKRVGPLSMKLQAQAQEQINEMARENMKLQAPGMPLPHLPNPADVERNIFKGPKSVSSADLSHLPQNGADTSEI